MTPQEFGERIRTHREAKGLSIEELAARFKLSVGTVRGIEEGSLDRMPHAVYAKGFVRAYAQAVGIGPEEMQAGLTVLFPGEMFADAPTVPSPVSGKTAGQKRHGQGSPILFSLLVLLLVGVAGWYVVTHFDSLKEVASRYFSAASPETDSSRPGAVMTQPVLSASPPPVPASPSPAPAPAVPERGVQTASAPEPLDLSSPQAPERPGGNPAAETPAAPQPVAPPPAAEILPPGEKRVAIDAVEECWVQASVDSGASRTFTVYPGETSVLPYKVKLVLVLGNAGGVTLTHNGKPHAHTSRPNEKKTFTFQ